MKPRLVVAWIALPLGLAGIPSIALVAAGAGQRLFPADTRAEADGTLVITSDRELRMPGTSRERADLPAGTRLTLASSIAVRAQGKTYDVQLWDGTRPDGSGEGSFGERVAVLAVFPAGAAEPTDVAEVKTDRETYLNDKLVALGSEDAFAIFNAHLNAGEDFNIISLFHIRDGRLRRIDEIFTEAVRAANCAESFREVLHWHVTPQTDALPRIVADVETIRAPRDVTQEDCPKRKVEERRTHARTSYRWDAKQNRYVKEPPAGRKAG